jgi:hypothetical protein
VLETTALRASRLSADSYTALAERVRRLEEGAPVAAKPSPVPHAAKNTEPPELEPPPADDDGMPARLPVQTLASAVREANSEDAKGIWGRLVTRFRKAGAMRLYALLGDHSDYRIEGTELVITAKDERFLQFSETEVVTEIERALSEAGIPYRVRVEKQAAGVDMDKEIERVKRATGLTPKIEK